MKKRSSKESAQKLFQVALPQQGYFTAKQAKEAGYTDAVHGYHIANGDWERAYRGIYRLKMFPPAVWPELVVWSLWTRGRDDQPVAVFSHETALQLSKGLYPGGERLHVTVPRGFRKGVPTPPNLVLYKQVVQEKDLVTEHGIRYTGPAKTQKDLEDRDSGGRPARPAGGGTRSPAPRPASVPVGPTSGWAAWA